MREPHDERARCDFERRIGMIPGVRLADLQIAVANDAARVQGVVPKLAARHAALEAAREAPGVHSVQSAQAGISVETTHPPTDQELEQAADDALFEEGGEAMAVGAVSQRGTARLVGEASSIAGLGRAAETVEGVPNAVNTIDSTHIAIPYGSDQLDLVNAVAYALNRDPVLRERGIRAALEDAGKIVLQVTVRTPEEPRRALEVAAEAPGVPTVREELQIAPGHSPAHIRSSDSPGP
ncbi:MAG: BON domain-containing protein [Actinomycetota bacterium]